MILYDTLSPAEQRRIIGELYNAFESLDLDQRLVIQDILNSPTREDSYYLCARVNELWKGALWPLLPGVVASISWRNLLVELANATKKIDKPLALYSGSDLLVLILTDYKNLRNQFMKVREDSEIGWTDLSPIAIDLKRNKIKLFPIFEKLWANLFGPSHGRLLETLYLLKEWNFIH